MNSTEALLLGLCRTMTRITVSLVVQGALDRETTIRGLQTFRDLQEDDPDGQATRFWTQHVIDALAADPDRPPPAPVFSLRPPDTNNE